MTTESTALQELKAFLNKLFQFESQDLDFGIYKILHYKRNEIKQFINELLVDRVKKQLQTLSTNEAIKAENELRGLSEKETIAKWLEAKANNDIQRLEIYEADFKKDIRRYKEVERIVEAARAAGNAENVIYNHLSLFFSRYYDKGDFISKRRFGKNEKYMVPYNGEETHFYWANHDQYYIKSAEHFQKYCFKVPCLNGTLVVNFKLTEVETEQGNVKADENKYFVLSEKEPELSGDELNIYFEYRALTEQEKKQTGTQNKQDKLDEQASRALEERFKSSKIAYRLWEINNEQSLILQHIHRYTRKNKYDFFIHKNLKGFLQRELDYYIKSELVNVDDLYVLETDLHFDRIRHNFRTIKVFKNIADIIIEFLSHIEDFQKMLWEKKKFVLNTEWVITVDRFVEWLGEEGAKPFMLEAVKNARQVAEWKELFGEGIFKVWEKMSISDLASLRENVQAELGFTQRRKDAKEWKKLPIDTVHFSPEFKLKLINALSEKIDLEEKLDGLVIHSDNFHGLGLLQGKFNSSIYPVYIDPPYNTGASAILYKNNYKDSSFFSLMAERLKLANQLMDEDGIICVAIDDEEVSGIRFILSQIFNKEVGIVAVRSNPAGRKTKGKFAPAHEYALFFGNSEDAIPSSLEITEKRIERYPKKDAAGHFAWANFIRSGNNDKREDRPKLFYPIFVKKNDSIRIPVMEWNKERGEYTLLEAPVPGEVIVYPIIKNGDIQIEKNWQRGHKRVPKELNEYRVRRSDNGDISIDFKTRMDENSLPITWWDKKEYASANYGAAELKELFKDKNFDFPKSRKLVLDCIKAAGGIEGSAIVLDFFPGSGTTFDATQRLNREDQGQRKCILIEQGDYIYSIIIPRIKKVSYTFDWKDGQPKNGSMTGLGIFLKYQRLEQYEEALENIAFSASEKTVQKALEFKDYIPKYFLEFETRDSQTLVNTEAMADPWDYQLKVWDGFTYDTQQAVDLVETFNYLIGLHMQKCVTKEIEGRRYQFVHGRNNSNRQILIIWRNVKDWDLSAFEADGKILREELKDWAYDVLYINGQAHIEGYQPVEEVFKNKMNS
ncbi:MAG: site-specific DNA-methyltransferase [Deltaproteobacteria bacterium]|nr:site-specific DNA-methyltransferase [Deltaproteobacteria bacterium]